MIIKFNEVEKKFIKRALEYTGKKYPCVNFQTVQGKLIMSASDEYRMYMYDLGTCDEDINVSFHKEYIKEAIRNNGYNDLYFHMRGNMLSEDCSAVIGTMDEDGEVMYAYNSHLKDLNRYNLNNMNLCHTEPVMSIKVPKINIQAIVNDSKKMEDKYKTCILVKHGKATIGYSNAFNSSFPVDTDKHILIYINARFLKKALTISKEIEFTSPTGFMRFKKRNESLIVMPMMRG